MGKTKTELFSTQHNELAAMAKALAHPARIAILEYLVQKGTCVCGDIVEELPLSQATVSQHLKAMKEVGLIKGQIDGKYRCYCVDAQKCTDLMQSISKIFVSTKKCC